MVRGDHLVTGTQPKRVQHDGDPDGGVGHQRRTVGVGAEEPGDVPTRVRDPLVQPARVEALRVGVNLVAQPLLHPLHRHRDRAGRAVVEVGDRGIEGEQQPGPGQRLGRARR